MPTVGPADYQSFLVRFWFDPDDGRWHGEVEHIQSARRCAVYNLSEVVALLATWGAPASAWLRSAADDGQPEHGQQGV